jgi:hypothetical protein
MELLKRNLILRDGGGNGGNSIDITQASVNDIASEILVQKGKLETAFETAQKACKSAVDAFDDGDSNKEDLRTVLNAGTSDIESAIKVIEDFANRLSQSSNEWDKAEKEIKNALAEALAAAQAAASAQQ